MIGKVVDKKEVATGTLQVTFEISQEVSFKPGQYVFVTLPYLLYPDNRGGKRQFSINNSPSEKGIIRITTRLSDSGFKKTLNELPIGSEIELGPIAGVFTLPKETDKPLVFLTGGIGITPFLSMLTSVAEEKLPYNITLIYSNRNQASAAYLGKMEQFKSQIPNLKIVLTMTDDPTWQGEKRIINEDFIKEYFPNFNTNTYFVVGPPGMVEAIRKTLLGIGVNKDSIRFENFVGY